MEIIVKEQFEGYDEGLWEKTAFFYETNGFLVTSRKRMELSTRNKNEALKFQKERQMCLRYAGFGFRIEHLAEYPGVSSSDVNILHHPSLPGHLL